MNSHSIVRTLFWIAVLLNFLNGQTQTRSPDSRNGPVSIGLAYGIGTQQAFPFNSSDYRYSYDAYRILLNYRFSEYKAWKFEITVEPSIYSSQHQLLNVHYIQPRHGSDYLDQRELLIKNKSITEYALDLGILVRYQTFRNFSMFFQASVGPLISNRYTERMAEGFAFSDIIALGCSPKIGGLQIVVRTGFRHISNFNLQEPNSGYNALLFEMGLTYNL
ncbi:acyloxyacyl hydrolase [Flavobacteriaceae bacterium D16]|nr:acyloxyacyl hydrolase [Flavobacteriaceae bacterium D16]